MELPAHITGRWIKVSLCAEGADTRPLISSKRSQVFHSNGHEVVQNCSITLVQQQSEEQPIAPEVKVNSPIENDAKALFPPF